MLFIYRHDNDHEKTHLCRRFYIYFYISEYWCQASSLCLLQRGHLKDGVVAIWFPVVSFWLPFCPLARWLPMVSDHHAPPQALSVLSLSLTHTYCSPSPCLPSFSSCYLFPLFLSCFYVLEEVMTICLSSVCHFVLDILSVLLSWSPALLFFSSVLFFSLCHSLCTFYLPVGFRIKLNI